MSFTYVMCLLDYLIMFVFPHVVTDRCLLETSKIRKDPSRCPPSFNLYQLCSAADTVALPALQSCRAPVARNDFTSTPDKYIHCHPLTCQKLTEMDFLCT